MESGRGLARWAAAIASATVVVAGSASGATAATLSLSRQAGPPTTSITAKGSGFTGGDSVTVSFDGTALKVTTVKSTGTFSVGVTVPASAIPGSHELAAADTGGVSASAPFVVRTDWSEPRFDSSNSAFNPYENVLTPESVPGLALRDTRGPGGVLAYAGGALFARAPTAIYATDAASGADLWSFSVESPYQLERAPAVAYSTAHPETPCAVFAGQHVLDPASGTQLRTAPGEEALTLDHDVGSHVFGEDNGAFVVEEACTGTELWHVSGIFGSGHVPGQALAYLPKVKAPDGRNHAVVLLQWYGLRSTYLTANDAVTGEQLWQSPLPEEAYVESTVAYGTGSGARFVDEVGLTGKHHELVELNASTGTTVWSHEGQPVQLGLYDTRKITASGGLSLMVRSLIATGPAGELSALNPKTGAAQWSRSLGSGLGAPAAADGVIYVVAGPLVEHGEEELIAVNALNGTTLFSAGLGEAQAGAAESAPIVADGHVYVSDSGGVVRDYALP